MNRIKADIYSVYEHNLDVVQPEIERLLTNKGKMIDIYRDHISPLPRKYTRGYKNWGKILLCVKCK